MGAGALFGIVRKINNYFKNDAQNVSNFLQKKVLKYIPTINL